MPDLINRAQHEAEIAYGFAAVLERQRRELARLTIPQAAAQPPSFWKKHEAELAAIALMLLRRPWEFSFNYLTAANGTIVTPSDRTGRFQRWGETHARELGGLLVDTNRSIVKRLAERAAAGERLAGNERDLLALSDDERTATIAITETTTAASRGEFAAAQTINREWKRARQTQKLVAVWRTERDERVCSICSPLDGRPYEEWRSRFPYGSPAHVKCRCWIDWVAEFWRWN